MQSGTIDWLLDSDPAIRWQALQDVTHAPARQVARERAKVAREGWGARLLGKQDALGRWAAGKSLEQLYTPKWTSTTYTMLLLRDLGLPPSNRQAGKACALLLDGGTQRDGGFNFGPWRISETCITGMVTSILAYFEQEDSRLDGAVKHLLEQQMPDGGWNCRRRAGATHSSFHTTISALEGLRHYELMAKRNLRAVRDAQQRGREFLLVHRLFRSHRTGEVIKPEFTRLSFPPRWHYDILRGLDYFRDVDAPRDERMAEAVEIVRRAQDAAGRWPLQYTYKGKTFFEMERVGAPSRWNTLRALRVLKWWDEAN